MTQPDLFDQPPSVHTPTSQEAAERIAPHTITLRQMVYDLIESDGPICDEQIANQLELNPSTARPRRRELQKAGLIRPSLHLGITSAGRKSIQWELVPGAEQGL